MNKNQTATPLTTLQVLQRGLRRVRKGWCQGRLAKDKTGEWADPASPAACKWCSFGAVDCHVNAINALRLEIEGGNVVNWNDSHTRRQSHVIALFRRTIARVRKEQRGAVRK